MRTARFIVSEDWLAQSAKCFAIPAGPLHHQITRVLRLKIGDHLSLLPNNGTEIDGLITDISKQAITGTLQAAVTLPDASPEITLAAAITTRDTFEWTLQKSTELGVTRIIPLLTERVIKRAAKTPQRWHDILREATEQSGRARTPLLTEPLSIEAALKDRQTDSKLLFDEVGGTSQLPTLHKTTPITLFIGPEGGFSEAERLLFANSGTHRLTLGSLVLRAETAALVGLSLLRFNK
jgi:16S rRNA (uracil1498-N3)-methyltransferase